MFESTRLAIVALFLVFTVQILISVSLSLPLFLSLPDTLLIPGSLLLGTLHPTSSLLHQPLSLSMALLLNLTLRLEYLAACTWLLHLGLVCSLLSLSCMWRHLYRESMLKPTSTTPCTIAVNTMCTLDCFPFQSPKLLCNRLILVLFTYMVFLCFLAEKSLLAERTSGRRFSTDVITFGLLPMNLDIANFAYVSLDYMSSHYCVIVDYELY
jgi:hypothetical protein